MRISRKLDLDRRLETYLAIIRATPLKKAIKRRVENWQIYAAVSSSAVAMMTGASAAMIGRNVPDVTPETIASIRSAKLQVSSSKAPLIKAVRLAMANEDARSRFFSAAPATARDVTSVNQAPSISPGGVVPFSSTVNTIQAGERVSIYGNNLADETAWWNGDFPTTLGGTSVQINGKPAYLSYVSPQMINLQAPDDHALGTVSVTVTTAAGTATSSVTLSYFAPSFKLKDAKHVDGIILRKNNKGAFGGGTYDILGPTGNALGYPTVAADAGDLVSLFAVGFGPTEPPVPAGQAFSGAAPITTSLRLFIGSVAVKPLFVGLTSAGLYQINLIVPPNLSPGDLPILAEIGGMQTQPGALFPVRIHSGSRGGVGSTFVGGSTFPPVFFTTIGIGGSFGGSAGAGGGIGGNGGGAGGTGGTGAMGGGTGGMAGDTGGGGTGGDGGGGSGGGSCALRPYQPKLRFTEV